MRKTILLLCLAAVFSIACENAPVNNASSSANNAPAAAASNQTAATPSNVAANETNADAAKTPSVETPKRISFNKGANWGSANITLLPNTAQTFVVSAKSGQTMSVESSSKELTINLNKGKAETTEDIGFLNADLLANGDYVFEVRNAGKKEIKSSIKVTIVDPPLQRGTLNDIDQENEKRKEN